MLPNSFVSTDKRKDRDQSIKDGRAEIIVELKILSSFTLHGSPTFAFLIHEKNSTVFVKV